ncbi:MAG TPA: hypothetical protein DIT25_01230 [Candidatus Moranbacteria bacterium]|nr:hypothetical protein [Candidatus Moranbacteria bacterium]
MELKKILKNYGLSEKQAVLYLATLELGSASVYKISKKSKIPGATCYEVLENLKEKGLASSFKKKNIRYYSAEDPKKIISRSEENIEVFKKALPQFNALYGAFKSQPTVRFYEGKENMKLILEEILDEADEIMGLSSAEDLFEILGDYWPKFLEKRIKKKIPVRTILRESEKARERKELGISELRQVRLMPKNYVHHGLILMWSKKTAVFTFKKEITALVIESEEINQIQKAAFNFMWDSLA